MSREYVGPLFQRYSQDSVPMPVSLQHVQPFRVWHPVSDSSGATVVTNINTSVQAPVGPVVSSAVNDVNQPRYEEIASNMVSLSSEYSAVIAGPDSSTAGVTDSFLRDILANAAQNAAATVENRSNQSTVTITTISSATGTQSVVTRSSFGMGLAPNVLAQSSLHPMSTPRSATVQVSAPGEGIPPMPAAQAAVGGDPMDTRENEAPSLFIANPTIPLDRYPTFQGALKRAEQDYYHKPTQPTNTTANAPPERVSPNAHLKSAKWLAQCQQRSEEWDRTVMRTGQSHYVRQATELQKQAIRIGYNLSRLSTEPHHGPSNATTWSATSSSVEGPTYTSRSRTRVVVSDATDGSGCTLSSRISQISKS